jgi:aspartate racemase
LRKLGLIGGMSWVSTRTYYEQINRIVQRRLDGRSSAPLLIESLDFAQLFALKSEEEWRGAAAILSESARRLEQAGAGALVIGANSMHRVYDEVAGSVGIPIFHIADRVGERMAAENASPAVLIGTSNVMTEHFYRRRLVSHGIDLLPPDLANVEALDALIYEQLMTGKPTRQAERALKTMITKHEQAGARAIVLACTELEQVVDVDANVLPIYDSTRIHAECAAEWILGGE